jgi:DNA repair protein RadC
LGDTPVEAAAYWRLHVPAIPYYDADRECCVVLLINSRRMVKGHHLVSIGTLDTILVQAREVFRLAVMTAAAAIILTHNHPSGDPMPSSGDISVTRDMVSAGRILNIEVLDHIIMGNPSYVSLRALGYFPK